MFISGSAGVGKKFLLKVYNSITKYLKRIMKYQGHNLGQTVILLTVSTEKAATGTNGNTVYCAFNLSIFKPGKQFCYKKLLDEEFYKKDTLRKTSFI